MHRIRVRQDILVERSHGEPVRFSEQDEITAQLHATMRDGLICFYVEGDVCDFVYFPTEAIEYEPITEDGSK